MTKIKKLTHLFVICLMVCMMFSTTALAASPINAKPTTSTVLVNGSPIAFQAYEINGNNYFKLRSLAVALNNTTKQFNVIWDGQNDSINLFIGQGYIEQADDMTVKVTGARQAVPNTSAVYVDGVKNNLTAYTIDGHNFVKLRDVMALLNVGTEWDGANNTIRLDTSKVYEEVKVPEVVTPPVQNQTENNVGNYATYPKEGDVINGKTVTRDADTGILGLDVKGGIYLGITMTAVDGTKTTIKVGSYAGDDYDNMSMGDQYVTKHGYTFWGSEWRILDNYAGSRLPMATSALVGTKADIKGNIIKDGSSEPAFYECQFNQYTSSYRWNEI